MSSRKFSSFPAIDQKMNLDDKDPMEGDLFRAVRNYYKYL